MKDKQNYLHIAMYPWFAFGHLNPFLNISNKLAERGHRISFFVPGKTQVKLENFNFHTNLITFIPLTVPTVEGLPPGSETTSDVPVTLHHLIMTAMDSTKPQIESSLHQLKPDFIFFDFTHWVPPLAKELGIKSIEYCTSSMATIAFLLTPACNKVGQGCDAQLSEDEWMEQPPADFPPSKIKLHRHEAKAMSFITYREYGSISFHERIKLALTGADAIGFRSCRELEGAFIDFIEKKYGKQVLLSGLVLPTPTSSSLEEKWDKWLNNFRPRSVIFCAFGSECLMKKDQFQELVLGFELTKMPFFVALKPPLGVETIDEALPKGFKQRNEGRGIVEGCWVQQQLIMSHPSIGCFVSHCGFSSIMETLVNNPQLVLLPNAGDQYVNSRLMCGDLKVRVEVERREDDGWFSKEDVCKAIEIVMEEDNEIGKVLRENKLKLKGRLLKEGLESDYITTFIEKLRAILV